MHASPRTRPQAQTPADRHIATPAHLESEHSHTNTHTRAPRKRARSSSGSQSGLSGSALAAATAAAARGSGCCEGGADHWRRLAGARSRLRRMACGSGYSPGPAAQAQAQRRGAEVSCVHPSDNRHNRQNQSTPHAARHARALTWLRASPSLAPPSSLDWPRPHVATCPRHRGRHLPYSIHNGSKWALLHEPSG